MTVVRTTTFFLLLAVFMAFSASAQEKPADKDKSVIGAVGPIKLSGLMFGDLYYNANAIKAEDKDVNGWQFRRIYFTADYTISDAFSSRFRLEADQSAQVQNKKIAVFVKDAWLKWKDVFDGSDLVVGISPTPAFDVSESVWGYRSLEKTIMDYYGIVPSRDLGIDLKGKIDGEGMVKYWVKLGDNSGNTAETNKYKRYYGQLQFKPSSDFQVTLYGDYASNSQKADSVSGTTKDNGAFVFAGFVNYNVGKTFSIGLEAFMKSQSNNYYDAPGQELMSQSGLGISAWATFALTEKISLVGRYDSYDPNTASSAKNDANSLIVAAVDFKVAPTVSVMPGIEVRGLEGAENSDIVPRATFYWVF